MCLIQKRFYIISIVLIFPLLCTVHVVIFAYLIILSFFMVVNFLFELLILIIVLYITRTLHTFY